MCQVAQALCALQPSYTLKEKKHCGREGPLQTRTFTDHPVKEALAEINCSEPRAHPHPNLRARLWQHWPALLAPNSYSCSESKTRDAGAAIRHGHQQDVVTEKRTCRNT